VLFINVQPAGKQAARFYESIFASTAWTFALYQTEANTKHADSTTRNRHCLFMAQPLPNLLASCLNFYTCMGKRLLLNGGENTHLFPVVSELGTTVEANHVSSRLHGGRAAALSRLAGLGKADSFVPASEQSVKDLHNLLLAVASSSLILQH
jgi:hypothetical protein